MSAEKSIVFDFLKLSEQGIVPVCRSCLILVLISMPRIVFRKMGSPWEITEKQRFS